MSLKEAPVIRTALAVQRRFGEDTGGFLAAGLSYHAFLSLFPLLLLAMSIIGFALAGDPGAQRDWAQRLSESVPGLEPIIGDNLQALVNARSVTGVIGLVGLLWTGMGLADAGTTALARVFRFKRTRGLVKTRLWALLQIAVLGVLGLVGIGVAGVIANLPVSGWVTVPVTVGGFLVTAAVDFLLFLLAYRLLSEPRGPEFRRLWPGALLGAVGWTILKLGGSWYAERTVAGSTGVYGTFAATVGILVLLHLAARVFLYGAELNAVTAPIPRVGKASRPRDRRAA